jgi:hypothetical protein
MEESVMAIPGYLSSSYRYATELGTITDVADLITAIAAELAANDPAWTSEGGGVYKSPVDADGRFFKITLTRIAAQNLEMTITDQNAVAVGVRRMQISSTYNVIMIYSGEFHFCIDVLKSGGSAESLSAGILDFYPQAQAASTRYVYGNGSRADNDTLSNGDWRLASMVDNATPTHKQRCSDWVNTVGNRAILYTMAGNILYHPREFWASTAAITNAFAGRAYQQIMLPYFGDAAAVMKVPLSESVVGYFRTAQGQIQASPLLGNIAYRIG